MNFEYIKTYDAEHFSFIRVPKLLVTDKLFEKLSAQAKFLYGIMLDRVSLSIQNGWVDERGNVYIYYTLSEIQKALCCGTGKAVSLMAELDSKKGIGLIERMKQGFGRPDIIYVKNFSTAAVPQAPDPHEEIQASEDQKSRLPKNESLDFQKSKVKTCENRQLVILRVLSLI
ncbi:MAG TPA: hypothetical protein DEQ02_06720 [Ruminococcaceae bacterium]|nr:hypothetical protein [Oscillospiraceae bacterium]